MSGRTYSPSSEYRSYIGHKKLFLLGLGGLCLLLGLLSVTWGAVRIPISDVIEVLFGRGTGRAKVIIMNIRLPQTLAAMLAGGGLSLAGVAMQAVLRNPLGSPFTLGISNAAAFGAAFSIIILGSGTMQSSAADAVTIMNPWLTTSMAFAAALVCMVIVLSIVSATGGAGEVMVLAGVALSSLFTAGTMFLQYFADDAQLAAAVFWTFGDVSRASWHEIPMMSALLALALALFFYRRVDLNALCCGDETALSLGVSASRIRLEAMVAASLLAAVMVAFLGVIGFVGLVCPHMLRRFLGTDHRFLIPGSVLLGAALLTGADMGARLLLAPRLLPVSVLMAFMGAPVFLVLLMKRRLKR